MLVIELPTVKKPYFFRVTLAVKIFKLVTLSLATAIFGALAAHRDIAAQAPTNYLGLEGSWGEPKDGKIAYYPLGK
jgi:hypothetical protein